MDANSWMEARWPISEGNFRDRAGWTYHVLGHRVNICSMLPNIEILN